MIEFEAVIQSNDSGGAWVEVPVDVKETFGSGRPKIKAWFDGKVEYRGSLANMGGGYHMLLLRKDKRKELGKEFGDQVQVAIELDTEPRVVEVPEILQKLFQQHPEAKVKFDKISYTHKKEYTQHINEAKKEETQIRRAAKVIDMLTNKK